MLLAFLPFNDIIRRGLPVSPQPTHTHSPLSPLSPTPPLLRGGNCGAIEALFSMGKQKGSLHLRAASEEDAIVRKDTRGAWGRMLREVSPWRDSFCRSALGTKKRCVQSCFKKNFKKTTENDALVWWESGIRHSPYVIPQSFSRWECLTVNWTI